MKNFIFKIVLYRYPTFVIAGVMLIFINFLLFPIQAFFTFIEYLYLAIEYAIKETWDDIIKDKVRSMSLSKRNFYSKRALIKNGS